jgi:hypothetical protein
MGGPDGFSILSALILHLRLRHTLAGWQLCGEECNTSSIIDDDRVADLQLKGWISISSDDDGEHAMITEAGELHVQQVMDAFDEQAPQWLSEIMQGMP